MNLDARPQRKNTFATAWRVEERVTCAHWRTGASGGSKKSNSPAMNRAPKAITADGFEKSSGFWTESGTNSAREPPKPTSIPREE